MNTTPVSSARDAAIDIARGIAIIIMIGANMGPLLEEPHSWLMRIYSSFAAPIFVMLAGMMIARTAAHKNWPQILKRAVFLLACAAFVDMAAWSIRPFLGMDVLYLLGIGTVITFGLCRVPARLLGIAMALVLLATLPLQQDLGYTTYPTELELISGEVAVEVEKQTPVWQHYILDGWFPIFPWLAFMLFGAIVAGQPLKGGKGLLTGIGLTVVGAALWILMPGMMLNRGGFSELFYPPTIGFFLAAIGVTGTLLALADMMHVWRGWTPVKLLGRHSLAIYVLHSIIIGRLFVPQWGEEQLQKECYLLVYGAFVTGMVAVAFLIDKAKAAHPWKKAAMRA